MFRQVALAVSFALGVGLTGAANASATISIDPDGAGALWSPMNVTGLDWQPSSGLSVTPFVAALSGAPSQFYAHGRLGSFACLVNCGPNDPTSDSFPGSGGLVGFEWTFVTGLQETVTAVTAPGPTGSAFDIDLVTIAGGDNFFRIYQGANDSSSLGGTGFNNGTLIYEGIVLPGAVTNFQVDSLTPRPLDQFGTDQYPLIDSVGGTPPTGQSGGNTVLRVLSTFVNPLYFIGIGAGFILEVDSTSEQVLAFGQVDPSACFTAGADGTGAPSVAGAGNAATCGANTLGSVNGDPVFVAGAPTSRNNVQVQIDANSSFLLAEIPEPGSLALLGLGLLGLGIIGRQRNALKS